MSDYNERIMAEFHETAGKPNMQGRPILLLHAVGAQTGADRTVPLMFLQEAESPWYVFASMGGAPQDPAWYRNVLATPEFDISVGDGTSIDRIPVRARVLEGAEREETYAKQASNWPQFADYAEKTTRDFIPVVELTRR